jgi:hypothetical protein
MESINVPIARLDSLSSGTGRSATSSFAKMKLSALENINGVDSSADSIAILIGTRHWIGRPRGNLGGRAATAG